MHAIPPTINVPQPSIPNRVRTDMADEDSHSSSSNSPARQDYEESDFYGVNNDSESSIGVPAFQDMAVVEEPCLSPAARLPAEVLIGVFAKLLSSKDLLSCMLVSKRWARNAVDLLWHRPTCTSWDKHKSICKTLSLESPYFAYRDFVKRLNLASLAPLVSDGSVTALSVCKWVERLTLTNCQGLTDSGLIGLVQESRHLLALDVSGDHQITEASIIVLAENCRRLQGLNVSSCTQISNRSLVSVAENCRYLKRLKLNDCRQLEDEAVMAFAKNCPNILEIDLHMCGNVRDNPITALLAYGQSLRELRLANCEKLTDYAFTNLPFHQKYENLRIVDLTSCALLTDSAVERLIDAAPRLRNLIFAKCRNLTDVAVRAIAKLGKNLHYLHLGHCGHITDEAVKDLVSQCNRIRYVDLGCCVHLTDESVMMLASLPKLRRIGLVKCAAITDSSVYALATSHHTRARQVAKAGGPRVELISGSNLERVHLSYCVNLTLKSIVVLLNNCQKLTHLSLTGVQAFLRDDLEQFCREPPSEFTEHQRSVFCVFSGEGVKGLRKHLNALPNVQEEYYAQPGLEAEDQTMTGLMDAAALNAEDDVDADDGDEELDVDEAGAEP